MQVFLNLSKNSIRAMETVAIKRLTITMSVQKDSVIVRFEDTGTGIENPLSLFRPFQNNAQGTGLGLYVSRALVKSFGGDLVYERRDCGCCFAVVLERVTDAEEAANV
jgi:C4-dicarboxylate-specific signal transduction histidine kinase